MLTKIQKYYQLYILPILITISFNLFAKPAFAADISRSKVAADGGAQYNNILIVLTYLSGIFFAIDFLGAVAVGMVIAFKASKELTQANSSGFQQEMKSLGKLFVNLILLGAVNFIIFGILQTDFFAKPK